MCIMEVGNNPNHPISVFLENAINYLTLIKTLT